LLAGTLVFARTICAQSQATEAQPKPAARAYLPIGGENDQDANQPTDKLQPDDRPLTGLQQPTVGTPTEKHSYWVPGVSYYNFIQSNAISQGGGNGWNSTGFATVNLSLLQNWSRSQFSLNCSGGSSFSTDSAVGDSWFQQLGAVQTINWQRWQWKILDQFSYLPQSQFGFGAGYGIGSPGVGGSLGSNLPGLQSGFNPSQSIFTAVGPRYSNAFGTQINYMLTRRSSVTLGGVYGLLRFTDPGNIESNNVVLSGGYNYQIDPKNSLGASYRFSAFHYIGDPRAIGDHLILIVYGRKITGRLALQLSGGPEITNYRLPAATSTQTQYVAGSAAANLTYAFAQGSVSVNYSHGVNNGSGVFVGAASDQVSGSISRRVSRVWSGYSNFGYTHNRNVAAGTGTSGQSYNTIYAGGSLSRPLGRNANFSLGYTAYIETSNKTVCAGPSCGTNYTTNQITVGLSWHTRPLVLH
jgi:hypothetical protein